MQIVDVEDGVMAPSGTNKKVTAQLLANELADIVSNGSINLAKLSSGALPSGITVSSTNISNDTIVDADINSNAAIASTKLAPIVATGSTTARTLANRFADVVNVKDFGAIGDGVTDDTAAIQAAASSATGKTLTFDGSATYNYTFLTFPLNSCIVTNGAIFKRITPSASHGITIQADTDIDQLVIQTLGGSGGDKSIRINGSNVNIGFVNVIATTQGTSSSANWAIEIESTSPSGFISRIKIGELYCQNMSTAVFAKRVSLLTITNAIVQNYRTAFYFRDVARSSFSNITCRGLGAAVNGRNGENGLLIESIVSSGSCQELLFENWYVADSGEHSYRLGGALAIKDVWFLNCTSEKAGSSILTGDTSYGEWHGGCGFKVLGGNSTITEYHENIHFENCGVIDTNISYGAYPTGHGVNNFTPWLIVMAKNVYLSNCWTKAVSQSYCARNGILFTSVDGLHLNNNSFRDINLVAIKPYEELVIPEYPGQSLPIKNVIINGGLYEITTSSEGGGIVFYVESNMKLECDNWIVNGATFKGGSAAVRLESLGVGGSYSNIVFKFNYVDSIVDNSTYASPIILGGGATNIFFDLVGPWRSAAFNPSAVNSSVFKDTFGGTIKIRKANAWVTL
jgi:hypothetical protein